MLQDIQAQLVEIFDGVLADAVSYVPRVLAGLVLLIFALIAASLAERLVRAVMGRMKFDALVRRTDAEHWLTKMGLRHSLNDVIPRVLYFVLLFLFAREAAESMGLTAISNAIGSLIAYLPNIIAAFLLLLLGSGVAQVAGRSVEALARGAGLEHAAGLGRFTTGVLLFVLVVMALAQLEIQTILVRDLAMVLVGGGALAVALSFGLGTRDITRNILAGFYARQIFRPGEQLEVGGHRGELEVITSTQTLLRVGDHTVVLANAVFLEVSAVKPPM